MTSTICPLSEETKRTVVHHIEDAVGDDLRACLRREHIQEDRSNGKKLLLWDLLNRNLIDNFLGEEITSAYAKRGPWHMVPLYDRKNGWIFSVMRLERFNELSKTQNKRKHVHYMDALAGSINVDLQVEGQLELFPSKHFDDEEVKSVANAVLKSFEIDSEHIEKYAVILFEESNGELFSVKCCLIDASLQIVSYEDWSSYILHGESIVVEAAAEKEQHMGLTLSSKAIEKIGRNTVVELKKVQEDEVQSGE